MESAPLPADQDNNVHPSGHSQDTSARVIDETQVRAFLGDDPSGTLMLIEIVLSDMPRYHSMLKGHVSAARWQEAAKVAHAIKGTAGNVAAAAVSGAAKAVEQAIEDGAVGGMPSRMADLDRALASMLVALDEWRVRLEDEILKATG